MVRGVPIDPSLGEVFSVGDALDRGLSRDRLRSGDLHRPYFGVRTRDEVSAIRGFLPRLRPGDRFSHTTAAEIWGAPLPRSSRRQVHVSSSGGTRPRSRGCAGHVTTVDEVVLRHGLPVSGAAQTIIECASLLHLDDVVAVCDFLVLRPRRIDPHDPRPYVARDELGHELLTRRGHGVRAARRAFALCRDGVESPMETRLRLLLTRAGVPEPECGFELRRPNGSRVGWFDLAWPDRRVIAEYDGDQHRTSTSQYERDIRRFDDAAELGWKVIRVRRGGIHSYPHDTVARVRRALG